MGTDIGNTGAVEFGIFDFQVNAKVFWMDNSQNGHFYGDLYLAGSSIGSQDWSGRGGTIDNAGYAVYASGANVANYLNGGIGPNFYFNTNDDTWTTAGYITAGGYYGNHYGNLYGNANSANYATNAQNDQNGNLIGAANWTGLGGIIDYAALSIALWDNASSPSHGFSWNANSNYSWSTWNGANFDNLTAGTVILYGDVNVPQGLIYPQQQPTSTAPTWVEGGMYYDTTLHKLRIGGVSGWETVTSV